MKSRVVILTTAAMVLGMMADWMLSDDSAKKMSKKKLVGKETEQDLRFESPRHSANNGGPRNNHIYKKDVPMNAKILRIDEEGNRFYFVGGEQITVSKNGDMVFLPEKI